MFHVSTMVWMPDPKDIETLNSAGNPLDADPMPIGIRFGRDDNVSHIALYLAAATEQHEGQFMDTINRCDQILESVHAIRAYALKRIAALNPGEEIVAIISDATEEKKRG